MLAAGLAISSIGIVAIIIGLYIGSLPECRNIPGFTAYCPIQPLWFLYRYSVLGAFIEILGLILVGKGYEIETPW